MTKRQKEEFAKLLLDLGKLIFASLVLGFFQFGDDPIAALIIIVLGLTASSVFFIIGLKLFKDIK